MYRLTATSVFYNFLLQRVNEKLTALERKYFGKDSPIRVAVVGCGYSGVELAATVSERLRDRGVVQAINVDKMILPNAPPSNRESALKVSIVDHIFYDHFRHPRHFV